MHYILYSYHGQLLFDFHFQSRYRLLRACSIYAIDEIYLGLKNLRFLTARVNARKKITGPICSTARSYNQGGTREVGVRLQFKTKALQKKQVPALVVHIPYREVLLTRAGAGSETTAFYLESVGEVWEAQAFAKLIQADYVDGAEAFKGYGVEEIRACWLPLDGHWNQSGAERFAEFVVPILQRWSERQAPKSAGSDRRPGVDSK